jgi:hypothetical protein
MRVNETELLKPGSTKKTPSQGGHSKTLRAKNRNFSPYSLKEGNDVHIPIVNNDDSDHVVDKLSNKSQKERKKHEDVIIRRKSKQIASTSKPNSSNGISQLDHGHLHARKA